MREYRIGLIGSLMVAVLFLGACAGVSATDSASDAGDADGSVDGGGLDKTDTLGEADAGLDGALPEGSAATEDTDSQEDAVSPVEAPRFQEVGAYETTIQQSGDRADVYYPKPADLDRGVYAFPLVIMLQGAKVDKKHYSEYARGVASYGFIVVVHNHSIPLFGFMAVPKSIQQVHKQIALESDSLDSPIFHASDTSKMALLGHSLGGVTGMNAIQNVCQLPTCLGTYTRPKELVGAVFWGTNLEMPIISEVFPGLGIPDPIDNRGIPIMLIQGELDSQAKAAGTVRTYEKIKDTPAAYVEIAGANHYGIANQNNPSGADKDNVKPTLEQKVSIETAARWGALFLRAHVLGDGPAGNYVHSIGAAMDANVIVESRL